MTRDEILAVVAASLEEIAGVTADEFAADKSFEVDGLDVDSLTLVELAVFLEDRFRISISDEAVGQWRTVDDVVRLVDELTAAAAA
jgi:acyl carrier protein